MSTAPGWYNDGSGNQRYWDGSQWTEHTAAAQPGQPGQPGQPQKKRRVGLWIGLGVGGLVLVVGGVVALLVVLVFNVTSGPRDALNDIYGALETGNCAELYSHLHEDITYGRSQAQFCAEETTTVGEGYSHRITAVSIENNTAVVTSTERYIEGGESSRWEYHFVKVDGEWLLRNVVPLS